MASKIHLFWASGSPPCWRVMLALEEKGLSGYSNKFLSFSKNENKSEEVLKWNPRGQLPTMVYDNSFAINESLAAVDFIEKTYHGQGTQLVPEDPKLYALMLQRKHEAQNLDQKGMKVTHYKLYKEGTVDGVVDPVKAQKFVDEYLAELLIWNEHVAKSDYLAGNKLTVADIIFFPSLALHVRCGLDLTKHGPNLLGYYNRMKELPSVQKTWPPHWKETPAPTSIFE